MFCAFAVQSNAQNLMDELLQIKLLLHQDLYTDALSRLVGIEPRCVASDNDTVKVLFHESMGIVRFERKEYAEVIKNFEPVPFLYEKLGIKDKDYIEAFLVLGMAYERMGNDSLAEKYYRTGLLRTVNSSPATLDYRSSFYLNLGQLYEERGDSTLADECYKRINPKEFDTLLDGQAENLINEGELQALEMREKGEFEQCLPVYDKLILRVKKIIGTNNETYIRLVYSKALVLHSNLKRYQEAKPLFKELFDKSDSWGGYNEDIAYSSVLYLQLVAMEGAQEELDESFPRAAAYISKSGKEAAMSILYRAVGNGAYWGGHCEMAIPYYEKYLALPYREEGLSYLEITNMLSVCYLLTGNHERAGELLRSLLKTYEKELSENLEIKSQVLHNYGKALMLGGNNTEARKYLTEANNLFRQLTGRDNPKTMEYIRKLEEGD